MSIEHNYLSLFSEYFIVRSKFFESDYNRVEANKAIDYMSNDEMKLDRFYFYLKLNQSQ